MNTPTRYLSLDLARLSDKDLANAWHTWNTYADLLELDAHRDYQWARHEANAILQEAGRRLIHTLDAQLELGL